MWTLGNKMTRLRKILGVMDLTSNENIRAALDPTDTIMQEVYERQLDETKIAKTALSWQSRRHTRQKQFKSMLAKIRSASASINGSHTEERSCRIATRLENLEYVGEQTIRKK